MKNWVKSSLATTAWLAVILLIARFLLPWLDFVRAESGFVRVLSRFTPAMMLIFVGAILSLWINAIYQRRLARKYDPRARRIMAEAQQWSDVFYFDEELDETVSSDRSAGPAAAAQPEVELSYGALASVPGTSRKPVAASNEPQAEIVSKSVTQPSRGLAIGQANGQKNAPSFEEKIASDFKSSTAPNSSNSEIEQVIANRPTGKSPVKPQVNLLPPLLPEFTGRIAELAELTAAFGKPGINILGLQGMGGIGKTTLAVKLAHEISQNYPDGQIYIDLKGANTVPMPAMEAQSKIIRAYLPTVRLPETEEELTRLYRSVLSDKRSLLLLDNAAGTPQVTPLLPPDGSYCIITSRRQLTLPQMFASHLDSLQPTEAQEMLARLVPQIGRKAEKVAELCGGMPLALRLAAGALTQKPGLALMADIRTEEYMMRLDILKKSAKQISHIDAVLTLSYQLLDPVMQRVWRLLALFPETFDVNAAAAVWKISPGQAETTLKRLLAFGLIENNRATGRFRLHDMMQRYADLCLTKEERTAGCRNHSEYFQSVLHEADALYEQGGELLKGGLNLLDLEWANIKAGQLWAAGNSERDRAACELCATYPDAGKYVRDLRQHPRERIRWSEAALACAKLLQRRRAECRHLIALGDSYIDLSEVDHAIERYDRALELAKSIGDNRGQADALCGLGTAYYISGGLNRAREYHQSALEISRVINDLRVEAISLGNLGDTYFALGEANTASLLFDQQLRIATQLGDRRNENAALGGLGAALIATGAAERAIELIEQQLVITREIGDRQGEASALCNLGHAYLSLNQEQWAVPFLEQALSIARELGDRRNEANALGGMGLAYHLKKDADVAKQFLEQKLKLAIEIGDRRGESQAMTHLGEVFIGGRDVRGAIEMLQQAFNIASQIGDVQGQANSLFKLALALDKYGDRRQAVPQAKTAIELFESVRHPDAEKVRAQLREWEMI